ncbi:TPA: Flp pilus assembly complex ATPase component TadA [Shewanella algae]|uniref:GspE/PulE family protein n=1 Tax=Shewanella algae TaxID=38313 RepID=UPI001C59723D|nr:ATPase, T2SS/T4P/T4SS family [Shewanella algae]HDS1208449.1 Flp pilus assembly complex ATPase component TadA [Shewanella algae]
MSTYLITDDELNEYYLEDKFCIAVMTGEGPVIYTTSYETLRIDKIVSHVQNMEGDYWGRVPKVKLCNESEIEDLRSTSHNGKAAQYTDDSDKSSRVSVRVSEQLQKAVDERSSDIHIEVYKNLTKILHRIDGRRVVVSEVRDREYGMQLIGNIFNTKCQETFEPKKVLNGSFETQLVENGVDRKTEWRAAYIPGKNSGGRCVLRWLNQSAQLLTLDQLGWTSAHVAIVRDILQGPSGIIMLTGKTNSGKTSALAAMLSEFDDSRAIHTLEDPVEYDLKGIVQTHVRTDVKEKDVVTEGFPHYSKALLRHDLDVEMHGEIRDYETAMEVHRKGETGQLLFSTLHTSTTIGIATTFIKQWNVPAAVVSAPELHRLWINTALVRTLCNKCKLTEDKAREYYSSKSNEELEKFEVVVEISKSICGDTNTVRYFNPDGCDCCCKGEKGRTSVVEMLVLDDEDRDYILRSDFLGWKKALNDKGFLELRDHAIYKIKKGEIDIRTAISRVTGLLKTDTKTVYKNMLDNMN